MTTSTAAVAASPVIQLPLPPHYNPANARDVSHRPLYNSLAIRAREWSKAHNIRHFRQDKFRICVNAIDVMNTFVMPGFELVVGGAVESTQRSAEWIYRYLPYITHIAPTIDLHTAVQIFHEAMWINANGEHPTTGAMQLPPGTPLNLPGGVITLADIEAGAWRVDPSVCATLGVPYNWLQDYALHYARHLSQDGKYPLMIWPYHAMLGGAGLSLVPIFEEACFFHNIARGHCQTNFRIKGGNPLSENYSVHGPEVKVDQTGRPLANAQKNVEFIRQLLEYDAIIIFGQAKSHCVAWTIADLLDDIAAKDRSLASKVYLVEDLTDPVVVPGIVDFTPQADTAFQRFADAGMHIVRSTTPLENWPGINL